MHLTSSSALLGLMLVVGPSAAHAQLSAPSQPSSNLVHTTVAISALPGADLLGVGAGLSLRTGGRSAFEVAVDWTDALHDQHWADQIVWFYFWQMKHQIWTDRSTSVLATYGTAGWVERQSVPPGRLRAALVPPFLPLVGVSAQRATATRVAIRLDGQVLIWPFESGTLFPRVSVGITVPLGRRNR